MASFEAATTAGIDLTSQDELEEGSGDLLSPSQSEMPVSSEESPHDHGHHEDHHQTQPDSHSHLEEHNEDGHN